MDSTIHDLQKYFWLILGSHFFVAFFFIYLFVDVSYVQVHNKIIKLVKSAFGHYPAQLSPFCLLPGGQFCPLAGL